VLPSAIDKLQAEVRSLQAEIERAQTAAWRVDAVLDQINAARRDAATVLSVLETPSSTGSLTPAERRRLCDSTYALLKNQHALLEQGRLLREEARARIARCAQRLRATRASVDDLLTGDGDDDASESPSSEVID
jgi:hypothetical protein